MKQVSLEYRTLLGRRVRAVEGFELHIGGSHIHAIIGPNGTGKTTIVRAAVGSLEPVSGTVTVFGSPAHQIGRKHRQRLGVLVDGDKYLEPRWTASDAISYYSILYGIPEHTGFDRARILLDQLDLRATLRAPLFGYSRGMRQKLVTTLTLLHDPDLVILDEPTLGLDAQGVFQVQELLRSLRQAGKGVLLTSHELHLLEKVCDEITVMERGRVLHRSTPQGVVKWATNGFLLSLSVDNLPMALLDQLPEGVQVDETGMTLICPLDIKQLSKTTNLLNKHGIQLTYVTSNCSLEQALKHIGGERERIATSH